VWKISAIKCSCSRTKNILPWEMSHIRQWACARGEKQLNWTKSLHRRDFGGFLCLHFRVTSPLKLKAQSWSEKSEKPPAATWCKKPKSNSIVKFWNKKVCSSFSDIRTIKTEKCEKALLTHRAFLSDEKSNQQMHCTYLFNFLLCFSPTCFGVARRHPQGVIYN
jgi:hypothetical protein